MQSRFRTMGFRTLVNPHLLVIHPESAAATME
jgi:hypothetical protein